LAFLLMTDRFVVALPRLPLMGALVSCLLLSACGATSDFPAASADALVTQNLEPRCQFVAVVGREALPSSDGLERVAVRYETDCVPEGGQKAWRRTAVMTFGQRQEWFGQKPWMKLDNRYEPDRPAAQAAPAAVSESNAVQTAGEWSDAPECNALITRVATEVAPCLDKVDPDTAQQLRDWLARVPTEFRVLGDASQRTAMLMETEERCLHQWRYRNKMIAGDRALKTCALK
jgi:hypothetical protein